MSGLCESVRQKWSGDVDLNDGKLEKYYVAYLSRLRFVSGLGLGYRMDRVILADDLKEIQQQLQLNKDFVTKGEFFLDRNVPFTFTT